MMVVLLLLGFCNYLCHVPKQSMLPCLCKEQRKHKQHRRCSLEIPQKLRPIARNQVHPFQTYVSFHEVDHARYISLSLSHLSLFHFLAWWVWNGTSSKTLGTTRSVERNWGQAVEKVKWMNQIRLVLHCLSFWNPYTYRLNVHTSEPHLESLLCYLFSKLRPASSYFSLII